MTIEDESYALYQRLVRAEAEHDDQEIEDIRREAIPLLRRAQTPLRGIVLLLIEDLILGQTMVSRIGTMTGAKRSQNAIFCALVEAEYLEGLHGAEPYEATTYQIWKATGVDRKTIRDHFRKNDKYQGLVAVLRHQIKNLPTDISDNENLIEALRQLEEFH